METCHVLRNHSSNHSIATIDVVGRKGILLKGDQPTLPLETHEIVHILRQQRTWEQEHATVNGGAYFVSCSTTFFNKNNHMHLLLFKNGLTSFPSSEQYWKLLMCTKKSYMIAIRCQCNFKWEFMFGVFR